VQKLSYAEPVKKVEEDGQGGGIMRGVVSVIYFSVRLDFWHL
jgi:hypothetical protein